MATIGTWLLKWEGSQFGPLNIKEVKKLLDSGRLKGTVLANRVGTRNWIELTDIGQLTIKNEPGKTASENASEAIASEREDARVNIMGTVSQKIDAKNHLIGVCVDISYGGLQVTNPKNVAFDLKGNVDLTINPISAPGSSSFSIPAKVAWVNVSTQRVGFEFLDLEIFPELKKYIRTCIRK